MSKWTYQGVSLTEPPPNTWGFVYKISWNDGFYIGQKSFWSVTNAKISKKRSNEIYAGRGKRPTREKKTFMSNWKVYNSSSVKVKELVAQMGSVSFSWEILTFVENKSQLNYQEIKHIICTDALLDEKCLNEWVSVKIRKEHVK